MSGAGWRAAAGKAVDQLGEPLLFRLEVALIGHDEGLRGRGIAAHRLIFAEHHGLHDPANDLADEHAGRQGVSDCPLHARRAVRYGLRHIHGAPLPLAVGAELRDSLLDLTDRRRFEKIFHAGRLRVDVSSMSVSKQGRMRDSWDGEEIECHSIPPKRSLDGAPRFVVIFRVGHPPELPRSKSEQNCSIRLLRRATPVYRFLSQRLQSRGSFRRGRGLHCSPSRCLRLL